eukprot:TRINITY_DN96166_c0_g1_i1.p1 TRINITY_DN96166_c0_g1~~TRINITY_DN96166_c0_g1_i1.p1  ORF type:complete len:472 (-),score=108.12 TRINITY_DN96166_c0_g1_i1:147-1520(-)
MDIPTVIQPGDKEDAIGRILDAKHPGGALLGADSRQGPSPSDALLRYRTMVNQIHPDRCVDQRAKHAFLRASFAFDTLCAIDSSPEASFATLQQAWESGKSEGAPEHSGQRWWNIGNVTDLDRCLEFRSAVMKSAWEELAPSLGGAALVRLQERVVEAEQACEHLDRTKGIGRNRLWPTKEQAKGEAKSSALRLVDLLCHLRAVHRFCQLHGRRFDHNAEMEAMSSPGAAPQLLQRFLAAQERKEANPAASHVAVTSCVGQVGDDDVDPLDAYMATVQVALTQEPAEAEATLTGSMPSEDRQKSEDHVKASEQEPGRKAVASQSETCDDNKRIRLDVSQGRLQKIDASSLKGGASNGTKTVSAKSEGACTEAAAGASLPSRTASSTPGLDWRGMGEGQLRPTASGGVHLTAEAAAAERRVADLVSGAAPEKAEEQRGLQNQLLGDLQSEESELEDGA